MLRPFTIADTAKLFALSGEDGMRRWIPDQVYRDLQHTEQVTRALIGFTSLAAAPRARPYVLGIEHRETAALIGHVGLSSARESVEIGYAIEQRHQGTGLATEAVSAVVKWALAELGLPEVLGIVEIDNVSSYRVLEKAGFTRVEQSVNGRGQAVVVYRRAAERSA